MSTSSVCPACGTQVSFWQVVAGPEAFAIRCRKCGVRLSKRSRAFGAIVLGIAVMIAISNSYGWLSWQAAVAFAGILALVSAVALLRVRVTLAGDDTPDRPAPLAKEPRPDSPPPQRKDFRGSSPSDEQGP